MSDASTLVGAVIRRGSVPDQALRHAFVTDRVAISEEMRTELADVLHRSRLARFVNPELRAEVLALLDTDSVVFTPFERVTDCRDPKDDNISSWPSRRAPARSSAATRTSLCCIPGAACASCGRPTTWQRPGMAPDGQGAGPAGSPPGSDDASPALPMTIDVLPVDSTLGADVIEHASADAVVAAILARHAHVARGAYALNTERALRADTAVFTAWCAEAGLHSLPAAPDTVAAFVDAMAEIKAPATVRRYVASVAAFHRAARLPNPCNDDAVRLALKRLHRARGRVQAQAASLTRDRVERLLDAAGTGTRALRNRALLAVAYDSLCRRSELVALQCQDLEAGPHGDGTLTLRRSKTDGEGKGSVRYLAPDTMRAVQAWLEVAGHSDGALFRSVGKAGSIGGPLDPGDVARVFKAMAYAAGLDPKVVAGISGHSSRVGAAQDQVRHGVELPAVMQSGGWKSPAMVARYSAKLDARRGGAAKLAMLQNRT